MSRLDFVGSEHGIDRLNAGVQTTSKAVRMLLGKNNLTHEELVRFSKWANPWGETWLSTSQVSYLRTATLQKAGPQTLDALAQVNLRLAQAAGDRSPLVRELFDFGPMPAKIQLPEEPYFLRHPDSREPLDVGGIYQMYVGRLTPEGLEDSHISDMEARRLSGNISSIVQAWARDRRLLFAAAVDQAVDAYDVPDRKRNARLKSVIAGFDVFSGEDLADELADLGKMLGVLDGDGPIEPGKVRERLYRLPKDS